MYTNRWAGKPLPVVRWSAMATARTTTRVAAAGTVVRGRRKSGAAIASIPAKTSRARSWSEPSVMPLAEIAVARLWVGQVGLPDAVIARAMARCHWSRKDR